MTFKEIQRQKIALISQTLVIAQTFCFVPAQAQSHQAGEPIRIAGQTVFVIHETQAQGKRGQTIQKQLDNALVAASDTSPQSVKIVYVKGLPVITVGGYQVMTVTQEDAKLSSTTPAVLAGRFVSAIKKELADRASTQSYIAQLSGDTGPEAMPQNTEGQAHSVPQEQAFAQRPNYPYQQNNALPPHYYARQQGYARQEGFRGGPNYGYQANTSAYPNPPQAPYGQPFARGRVVTLQAGLNIPATLSTAISTQVAKPGDLVQAQISQNIVLGQGDAIPAGSILIGQIVDAKGGGFFGKSGTLSFTFNRIRTPDGVETPITSHLAGSVGKYGSGANNTIKGETMGNKVASAGIRGLIGAGTGAALGTAIGAIAGRSGSATGRGAWSGTAIGGGLGLADSLIVRKGKNVDIPSGQAINIQLDAPATISGGSLAGQYGNNM